MTQALSVLGRLTPESFLQEFWQKKPIFIPNAIPNYQSPLSPDELAGLACEEGVESRLIMEKDGPSPWFLRHGPFSDSFFQQLPETHWTLLIQECNKYLPELAQLLNLFNFIPRWRIDDVMVSYATPHGSVGPHVDQYDVFLLQAYGKRRWQISDRTVNNKNFIPNIDLQIMQEFEATDEWIAQPGDILYLPPGLAHFGRAVDDCMTLSIGFRAPSYSDILANFVDYKIQQLTHNDPELRYCDEDLEVQAHCGEISAASLEKVQKLLKDVFDNTDHVPRWFGQMVTQTANSEIPERESPLLSEQVIDSIRNGNVLIRNEYSRFAFIRSNKTVCYLYIDAEEFQFDIALVSAIALLCDQSRYASAQLLRYLENDGFVKLLTQLINSSKLYFENDE